MNLEAMFLYLNLVSRISLIDASNVNLLNAFLAFLFVNIFFYELIHFNETGIQNLLIEHSFKVMQFEILTMNVIIA